MHQICFKPSLARGDIHCIGATTLNEYRNILKKMVLLIRRFQKILINAPSPNESIEILLGLKKIMKNIIMSNIQIMQLRHVLTYLIDILLIDFCQIKLLMF